MLILYEREVTDMGYNNYNNYSNNNYNNHNNRNNNFNRKSSYQKAEPPTLYETQQQELC